MRFASIRNLCSVWLQKGWFGVIVTYGANDLDNSRRPCSCSRRTGTRQPETTSGERSTTRSRLRWCGSPGPGECRPCAGRTSRRDGGLPGQPRGGSLRLLRHVSGRKGRTFAKEEVFHVLGDQVLGFFLPGHQA